MKNLTGSAFSKDFQGRHAPIETENLFAVTDGIRTAIQSIFIGQRRSEIDLWLTTTICQPLLPCCAKIYGQLQNQNCSLLCEETLNYKRWQEERRLRITGSKCYEIFTYTNNRKPDWTMKSSKFFNPTSFTSEYTNHGLKFEEAARKKFVSMTNKKVVEVGLIISQRNPWLAFSPDGVIFENGAPSELLEIKCPYKGKT